MAEKPKGINEAETFKACKWALIISVTLAVCVIIVYAAWKTTFGA
jgi:hypothetical protein